MRASGVSNNRLAEFRCGSASVSMSCLERRSDLFNAFTEWRVLCALMVSNERQVFDGVRWRERVRHGTNYKWWGHLVLLYCGRIDPRTEPPHTLTTHDTWSLRISNSFTLSFAMRISFSITAPVMRRSQKHSRLLYIVLFALNPWIINSRGFLTDHTKTDVMCFDRINEMHAYMHFTYICFYIHIVFLDRRICPLQLLG